MGVLPFLGALLHLHLFPLLHLQQEWLVVLPVPEPPKVKLQNFPGVIGVLADHGNVLLEW